MATPIRHPALANVKTDKGVYVLVLYLPATRMLTYGRDGRERTAEFSAGWYCCAGTAQGGVRHRLNHHYARDKSKISNRGNWWYVDYLREHSALVEVWFSHRTKEHEHVFAQALTRMPHAEVPIRGFSATDCDEACEAHLVFFGLRRPYCPAFRNEAPGAPVLCLALEEAAAPAGDRRADAYHVGLEYLERLRIEIYNDRATEADVGHFREGGHGRKIAAAMADRMGKPVKEIEQNAKFAACVESIVGNCGSRAYDALFSRGTVHNTKAIEMLSRTSDVRQRHCVEAVLEGRRRTVKPQRSDGVFDTVTYREVNSRLARAFGALRKVAAHELEERDRPLLSALEAAVDHMLDDTGSPEAPSREDVAAVLDAATPGRNSGRIKQALVLTAKNVWDRPEMNRRGIIGTASQVQTTTTHLNHLKTHVKVLRSEAGWTKVDKSGHSSVPDFLTIQEVAQLLRVSTKTIRRQVTSGNLPGFKLGGSWRFRRADIEMWVEGLMAKPRS